MENLEIYEKVRKVPKEALKEIQAGRLKGKSDINPMWRIKCLTEQFGLCGVGWKYEIVKMWLDNGGKDEIAAFTQINLFVKVDGQWSEGIPGIGGSSFVASEKSGLYTSDECYKMALTDAISVSCKALGFAADVYWGNDSTKYDKPQIDPKTTPKLDYDKTRQDIHEMVCKLCNNDISATKQAYQVWVQVDDIISVPTNKLQALLKEVTTRYNLKFGGANG